MASRIPNNLSLLTFVYFSHKPAGIFRLIKHRFTLNILYAKHDVHIFCNCRGRKFQGSEQDVCWLFYQPVFLCTHYLSPPLKNPMFCPQNTLCREGKTLQKCILFTFELHSRPYQFSTNISVWEESCLANLCPIQGPTFCLLRKELQLRGWCRRGWSTD